ncbi:MAG: FecR domain-containing protein [Dysgonamonadaceae bacterium]|jgi:ferric-dicitrate binding protein FerR (iron transport regulator)|nr:FecR domain-containing protein [Dysgonamonadaceae bacterium]
MNDKGNIWSSIASVLDGNPTMEAMRYVDNWIAEDERNGLLFKRLSDTTYNQYIEQNACRAKEYIYVKMQAKIREAFLRAKLRTWRYVAAASIAVLILSGSIAFLLTEPRNPVLVESKTPAGSVTKLTLDDSTIVVLNASSTISYPLNFNKKVRSVKLTGEGYFEVAKDPGRPFIVETNNMKINVLGTHFNVKSYNEDLKSITTLLEGSVKVEFDNPDYPAGKPVILRPGQQIIFDKTTLQTTVTSVNPNLYASWKDGQCFFENEKFIDIVQILERQFGITIEIISPSLENQLYSGFFGRKDGVLHILNSFRKHRNFDYKQSDTGIEIYEK